MNYSDEELQAIAKRITNLQGDDVPNLPYELLYHNLERARTISIAPIRFLLNDIIECQKLLHSSPIDLAVKTSNNSRIVLTDKSALKRALNAYMETRFGPGIIALAKKFNTIQNNGLRQDEIEKTLFVRTLFNLFIDQCDSKNQCYRLIGEIIEEYDQETIKKRVTSKTYTKLFDDLSFLLPTISGAGGIRR
ncbi:hypothetical protein [Fulvivirga sedimenti]|uniref:Uncharacterized protein n=1 Tax=Fulvivirga sedimenti TaxID=2879465 RepID=A0A9X1HXF5_9BACT|nr:hypothetical protein [Fulvivirga sedimenti]MCA6078818.1 hypothetical protein [Fulvivirga sedimenti]